MSKQQYITTPLYYVNAKPHLGHSYTTILADVMKRHSVQRGVATTFLTGTDEHGEKIDQMATKEGKLVQEFVDEVSQAYQDTWKAMSLDFDIFYRTTDSTHKKKVQFALQTLKDRGEIVFREYEGLYCVGCERFVTETELTTKGECPDHLKKPELRKEANYFFLMSQYQARLIEHLEKNPSAIRPDQYRTEMLSFLKQPLQDLCISRPKDRLKWGIELPFDANFVTYVWFDALMNYLCATGWPDNQTNWRELFASAVHLIGKDIVKTHYVYWGAMLMALESPLFKELNVNGYVLVDGNKMSKTIGNVVRPIELEAQFGTETLRFFLIREISYGMDSTFTLEGYVNSINAHLANGIGNFVSRVLTLCLKNFKGQFSASVLTDEDRALLAKRSETLAAWNQGFDELKFQNAAKAWCDLVTQGDLYINAMKPWALAKDPAQSDRLQVVLGVALQLIEALAFIAYPVIPQASVAILKSLGVPIDPRTSLEGVTENRFNFALASEVPKLFMRVQLPKED